MNEADYPGDLKQCAAREKCRACWQISAVGFLVPDAVWDAAVPAQLHGWPLCLVCFTRFADERGVEWDREIEFFPVSRLTAVRLNDKQEQP